MPSKNNKTTNTNNMNNMNNSKNNMNNENYKYEVADELGVEVIESDLLVLDEGTLKHDSLLLSTIVFSYLMRIK